MEWDGYRQLHPLFREADIRTQELQYLHTYRSTSHPGCSEGICQALGSLRPYRSILCSNSSFWLMRRQLRLYQERDAGYARADKHKLLPHTCSQQVRQPCGVMS